MALLPNFSRLRLQPTGEFYALDRDEADGREDPITTEPLDRNCERDDTDCRPTFRVRTNPKQGGGFHYLYYDAENLWRWVKNRRTDMISKQPVWREDWMALHDKYDPQGEVPLWVSYLPRMDKEQGEDTDNEAETEEDEEDARPWWEWGSQSESDEEEEEEEEAPFWFVDDDQDPPALGLEEMAQRQRDQGAVEEDTQRFFQIHQDYERPGAMSTALRNIERNVAKPYGELDFYRRVLFRDTALTKQLLESLVDMVCDDRVIAMNRRHATVLLSRFLATADKPVMPRTSRETSLNIGTYRILRGDKYEDLQHSLWMEIARMLDESDNKMYYLSDKDLLMTQTYLHPYLAALHVLHYLRYGWRCWVVPSWLLIPPQWQPHAPLPDLRVAEDVALLTDLRERVVKVAQDLWSLEHLANRSVEEFEGGEDGVNAKIGSIAEQLGFWPNPTYAARPYVPATGIMKALQDCRALPSVPTRLVVASALYVLAIYTHVFRDRVRNARLSRGVDDDRLAITCTKLRRVAEFAVETTEPTLQRGSKAGEDTMRAFFWRRIEPNREFVNLETLHDEEQSSFEVQLRVVPVPDGATTPLTIAELTTALSSMARDWATSVWPDDYDPSPAAMENARMIEQAERELQLAKARAEPRLTLRSRNRG